MVKFLPPLSKLKEEILAGKYGKIISYYHAFGMTFPTKLFLFRKEKV